MLRPVPLRLGRKACDRILEAAARAEPREACGVLADGQVLELPNTAEGNHSFSVEPDDLADALRPFGGWGCVQAVWHSHPEAASSPLPSEADLANHPVATIMIIAWRGELQAYGEDTEA